MRPRAHPIALQTRIVRSGGPETMSAQAYEDLLTNLMFYISRCLPKGV